jgi:hypothetical protein
MLPSVGLWLNASKSESMLAKVDETIFPSSARLGTLGEEASSGKQKLKL